MQNNNQYIKVSVIATFYNFEEYISRCLDSILTQDMAEFEIIAVNDGSTDSSGRILAEYAQKDSRVKVLELKNGGPGWARNQGVKRACGEYIWFVDGDDFIVDGSMSKLYNYAKENEADVVIFTFKLWQNDVLSKPHQYPYYKNIKMDAVTAMKFKLIGYDVNVWNKFYKRALFLEKNILFQEGIICEDAPVSCKMLCNAKRIFYLDEPLYYYVYRETSITRQVFTEKSTLDWFYSLDLIRDEVYRADFGKEVAAEVNYYSILAIMWSQNNLAYPEKFKTEQDLLKTKKITEQKILRISPNDIVSNSYFNDEEKNMLLSIRDLIIRGKNS